MKGIIKTILVTFILVVALAAPALAAGGNWVQNEDATWSYVDKEGEKVTDCWQKSGDKLFWLNEEGVMATNQLVEDGDHIYFVNTDGAMVKNAWVKAAKQEEDAEQWMYFGMGGKAVKDGKKDIGGKTYIFIDNYIQTGFIKYEDKVYEKLDEDYPYVGATYYCGGEDDGHVAKEEWVQTDGEDGLVWLYFKKNGCKVANGTFDVNGQTYCFAEDGAMITGFDATPSVASPSTIARYAREDGTMVKKGWIWALDETEEDYHWYYAKGNGKLVRDCVTNIDGKKFAFNADAEMIEGYHEVEDGWMYFATEGTEGHVWGSAYTGKSSIYSEKLGYAVTVNFTSYGKANNEVGIKKGFVYYRGVLVKNYNNEWDTKYAYVGTDDEGLPVVINGSGKILSEKQTIKVLGGEDWFDMTPEYAKSNYDPAEIFVD